jgi:hypothetical protein
MTAKTPAQLIAEINALYADNNTGLITPAIVRQVSTDMVQSAAFVGTFQHITGAGDVTVATTDTLIILDKTVAADTNFILPPDITKLCPVKIVDWRGIAATQLLFAVPNGAELINGQVQWQLAGAFASFVLSPTGFGLGYAV